MAKEEAQLGRRTSGWRAARTSLPFMAAIHFWCRNKTAASDIGGLGAEKMVSADLTLSKV